MAFKPRDGDVIALDNEKAGSLVMSTSLDRIGEVSTDPIRMFARRDAFRTVAEAIAQGIASVPFNEYEDHAEKGRSKLSSRDSKLAAALEAPQPRLSQFRFVEALHLDMVMHDRWAFLIEVTAAGYEFHRLPGNWVQFALDPLRRITHVVVWRGAKQEMWIPAEHCAFDVGFDPDPSSKFTRGYSISHTLESAAAELDFGAAYRKALLAGGPKVPMYIARPAEAPDWVKSGGRQRFVDTFKEYSAERAGEAPILEDGMKLMPAPQLDVNSVAYRETRLAAQIEFAIAMHFPPELVGYRPGNHSQLDALREQLYIDVLGGKITAFRQALNLCLRAAGILAPDHYIEENLGVRLASSPEKQAGILQTQVGAPVRTVNEARRMLNLPPVDGGDDLIVPLNVTKGGLASPTDTGPKSIDVPGLKAVGSGERRLAIESQRSRFAREVGKALERQADRVLTALGTESSPGSLSDAFDLDRENAELAASIIPHSYALAVTGAAPVLAKYDPESKNFDPEVMLPWLTKAAKATADRVNTATVARLAVALFEDDRVEATKAIFAHLVDATAKSLAQTVATASTSFGSQDAAKTAGLGWKSWKATAGSERHEHLDGEKVAAGAVFTNGLRWPGDPNGTAADTLGCTCEVIWSAD